MSNMSTINVIINNVMGTIKNTRLRRFLRCWSGPALLAALFVLLAVGSWRRWPDILIDFGHELYIPWRLVSGGVLYADIAHLYGPFSQYLNALVFRCFGVSFAALFTVDLVLTAGLTALLYTGFSRILDRLTAFACGALFLMVFAFSQLGSTGNYNFVSPYSH